MATIIGTNLDDVLATTATADVLTALNGNDVVLVALPAHHGTTENLNGGAGFDRFWFTSTSGGNSLVLLAATGAFEAFQIVDGVGNPFGTTALDLNASALTVGAILTGNDGINLITGSARNDTLVGGGGADTLVGGLGNDQIVIDVAATDVANGGGAAEGNTLALIGAATGTAIIDLAATDQLVSFGAAADGTAQSGFSHVDASGMGGFGVQISGSALRNVLTGSAGNDVFVYATPTDYVLDAVSGGRGDDVLRFSSTTPLTPLAATLLLNANLVGVERVEIASASGDSSGVTALNLNAAAAKAGITLAGNEGANSITGSAFNDKIYGNGGSDTLVGGAGNDIYVYDDAADGGVGDRITDASGTADFIAFADTLAGATLVLGATITGIEGVYAMGPDAAGIFDLNEATNRNIDGSALLAATGMKFIGNAGANVLTGGSGKDTLIGNGGADTIIAGLGADTVEVDVASVDIIDAGSAAEGNTLRLTGNLTAGAVTIDLSATADADQLLSVDGAADAGIQSDFTHVDARALLGTYGVTVTGSALANTFQGSGQADAFAVLTPADYTVADIFQGGAGNDSMRFVSTTAGETLTVRANLISVEEVEISDIDGGNDGLTALNLNAAGAASQLKLVGNDGANSITGSNFNDTLNGNDGVDVMTGGAGDDEYLYENAADFEAGERITDSAGSLDSVRFASTTDGEILTLSAQVTGIEVINFGVATDADTIPGPSIGVNAAALGKAVIAFGDDGNNTIIGTNFNDTIEGGKGADSIVGGLGTDTILINVDAGHQDAANAGLYAENNLLLLGGAEYGVVIVDLSVTQGTDQSSMDGDQIGFSRVDASAVQKASIYIVGRLGADTIIGGTGNDVFEPGQGVDFINGGGGNDRLIVHNQAELGTDTYIDTGFERGDYILFDSTMSGATLVIGAANISFGGGGGWDVAQTSISTADTTNLNINASAVRGPFGLSGNAGNNILTSTDFGESIFDYGGADIMNGKGGNDDYVIAVDWVVGDKINDTGGDRDDMYNATAGQVIIASPTTMAGIERFVVSGTDLSKGGNDYVRDIEALNNGGFDLNAWNVGTHIAGSFGNNYLRGTRFADTMIGHKGQDTIIGGLGRDEITMEVGLADVDQISAGLYTERNLLILKGDAPALVVMNLGVADGADQLIEFGVGLAATTDTLVQSGFVDVNASAVGINGVKIAGSATINVLTGTAQEDILDGRGGADTLIGGGANDAFVVTSSVEYVAGDRFDGGAGLDTVRFASTIAGQTLAVLPGTLIGIEGMSVADAFGDTSGTVNLHINAAGHVNALRLFGNDGNNIITGTAFGDTLGGGGGNDTLAGGAGNDVYTAVAPGEVSAGDRISDAAGIDYFRFTSETDGEVVVLTNLMTGLEIAETARRDGVLEEIFDTGINASAVTSRLSMRGNAGDNQLTGTAFNDSIIGGRGADTIAGGAGSDTITMLLEAADMDDVDGGAIADTGGNFLILSGRPAGDMVWDLSTGGDQLISINGVNDGHVIQDITHVNASAIPKTPAPPISITITGSAEANILIGGFGNDVFIEKSAAHFAVGERIAGGEGNDVLRFSSTGTDTLVLTNLVTGIESVQLSDAAGVLTGTNAASIDAKLIANALKIEGNDGANRLTGTNFADTIIGGGGSDTIVGGLGNDVITMHIGPGEFDAINSGAAAGEINKLIVVGAASGAVAVNLNIVGGLDQFTTVGDTLVQSGFTHVDASGLTGGAMTITGTAGHNFLAGGSMADTIVGGTGNDTIGYDVGGGSDVINAGVLTEVNSLVLTGAAAGTVVVDLALTGDQVTAGGADATTQSGFTNVDASAMTGAGINLAGTGAVNIIVGSAQADTIVTGGGADRITWDAGTASDSIDAGNAWESDTFVIKGTATGKIVMNLALAAGADQLISMNGVGDAAVQTGFQHLDARGLAGGGLEARGNALNNTFYGSKEADIFTGMAGVDTFWLGGGAGNDTAADRVVYERPEDGSGFAGASSFDNIREFKSTQDVVVFTGGFNGGPNDLDDIGADDVFNFVTNAKADFSSTHEAMLITQSFSGLANVLSATAFSSVVAAINRAGGVVAATGDDGLIVVQAATSASLYYYQESDGVLNSVAAGELTLLGLVDASLQAGDLVFG